MNLPAPTNDNHERPRWVYALAVVLVLAALVAAGYREWRVWFQ